MKFITVLAHEGEEIVEEVVPTLGEVIRSNSLQFSLIALSIILLLSLVALILKNPAEKIKYLLFGLIVTAVLANTIYLVGSTIYLNQVSATKGPVHWHADYEVWRCGQELELEDPKGLSNKVGSETVHEHNDKRMHFEGVMEDLRHASLGHFFKEVGGSLDREHFTMPTHSGMTTLQNGQKCQGQPAKLQVFVYKTHDKTFSQQKLDDPPDYIISPHSQIPPGDCVIIELDKEKAKTDKMCNFYKVAIQKGELRTRN